MATMSVAALKTLIVRTRSKYMEACNADWDRSHSSEVLWKQAAQATAPAEWREIVRILAVGWYDCGGSALPAERRL
jgi:hypothetical protein